MKINPYMYNKTMVGASFILGCKMFVGLDLLSHSYGPNEMILKNCATYRLICYDNGAYASQVKFVETPLSKFCWEFVKESMACVSVKIPYIAKFLYAWWILRTSNSLF